MSRSHHRNTWAPLLLCLLAGAGLLVSASEAAAADQFFNGFETNTAGWDVWPAPYRPQRVPSGTRGVPSSGGGSHAVTGYATGDWGGLTAEFPPGGFATSFEAWLDMEMEVEEGAEQPFFIFTSALRRVPAGKLSDYVISLGPDPAAPGQWIGAAGQYCGVRPDDPRFDSKPVRGETGWYTVQFTFRDELGFLDVDVNLVAPDGTLAATWDLPTNWYDPAAGRYLPDTPMEVVGGNHYASFCRFSGDLVLHIDNTMKIGLEREVGVDVRPHNARNQVNTNAKQLVPIAILAEVDLDPVFDVDISSITMRGAKPAETRFDQEDVNGDGRLDLVLYFRARDFRPKPDPATECGNPDARLGLDPGSVLQDGTPIVGSDFVDWQGPDCSK